MRYTAMADSDYMEGRIRDLARSAYMNDYITHTDFLSASEQAAFHTALRKLGVPLMADRLEGAQYLLYGGCDEAERQTAVFLPSWLDARTYKAQEDDAPQIVTCLKVSPAAAKFADSLTHRDYLGALMNLGITRGQVGDILIDRSDYSAYVFVFKDMADFICSELSRVKHTTVVPREVPPSSCTVRPEFEIRDGSVASQRLDAVLSFVCRLARGKAQELIEREAVTVDGRIAVSGAYELQEGSRVSVRGFGKFVFLGSRGTTKKGRNYIEVKIYK